MIFSTYARSLTVKITITRTGTQQTLVVSRPGGVSPCAFNVVSANYERGLLPAWSAIAALAGFDVGTRV